MQGQLFLISKTRVGVRIDHGYHGMIDACPWTGTIYKYWIRIVDLDSEGGWVIKDRIDRMKA